MTYANPAALVSTEWVADHLHDPHVRLFEVDVDTTAYDRGHLEGACGINWTTQLGDRIRRDIPSQAAWSQLLSECGVTADTRLVFYGDNNNWFAAFAYWIARIYGHTNASLMNGGRKKWELEGRPLVTDAAQVQATSYQANEPDLTLRAYLKDMLKVRDHCPAWPARDGATLRPHPRRPEHPLGPSSQRGRYLQIARRATPVVRE